jgi:predicted DNA-binding transcriptional regulator AlpA
MASHRAQDARVLTSWKEIAEYLGKGVRTVQRWEIELGLPVRRPLGSGKHVIVALSAELEEWVRSGMVATDRPRKGKRYDLASAFIPATPKRESKTVEHWTGEQLGIVEALRHTLRQTYIEQTALLKELRKVVAVLHSVIDKAGKRRTRSRSK